MKISSFRLKRSKNIAYRLAAIIILLATASGIFIDYFNQQGYSSINASNNLISKNIKTIAALKILALKKQPVFITLPNAKIIKALVDDYEKQGSIWALVNRTNHLSVDYIPANIAIPSVPTRTDKSDSERSVRADIFEPLKQMFDGAASYSYQLVIGSGYRSANLQAIYFNSAVASSGITEASKYIAQPGQSEHQTGLAVDITTVSRECYLSTCFADTSDGQWLAQNSYKYGFILRYPNQKESVTGYNYEPWHFRYVGIDLATALHESNLTLDEAWPYLQKALTTLKKHNSI
jgi:D-alanyl-D-alanine carboxypeptidase